MDARIIRYSEQPELWEGWFGDGSGEVWPEYNQHGEELNAYWGRLYEVFPEWQFLLYDDDQKVILAEGHTIPLVWDGDEGEAPTAVSALAAEIPSRHQGRGLARQMLNAMKHLTGEAGLPWLIAPVRPSMKDRYPTIPIERYAHWTRDDGTPFDPWIRAHTWLGARIGPVIPRWLHIGGTGEYWEPNVWIIHQA
jgi:GNAT superfamily N-acetyltransferase